MNKQQDRHFLADVSILTDTLVGAILRHDQAVDELPLHTDQALGRRLVYEASVALWQAKAERLEAIVEWERRGVLARHWKDGRLN